MILQWLVPLGFLGFSGIGALIIIYIIRPKYVRRLLPSTYMWIRSQKKRRKKIPLDPFRDFLIFLLQALAIAACTIIIASPFLISEETIKQGDEHIIIIEASENMRSKLIKTTGETRFERAIDNAKRDVDETVIRRGGRISIIIADNNPYFLVDDADRRSYSDILAKLNAAECSYAKANLDEAMRLAEDKVLNDPTAKITVYSGTQLGYLGDAVTCVNLADTENEWNIGICDCIASFSAHEYTFILDVAAFGKVSLETAVHFEIRGVDDGEVTFDPDPMTIPVTFNVDESSDELVQHIKIAVSPKDASIGGDPDLIVDNYEEILVQFRGLNDSLPEDDTLLVYGGKKDKVAIEYYTSDRNIFFPSGITPIEERYAATREITQDNFIREEKVKLTGYDFYFFEHKIPDDALLNGLPNDGVTVLLDPDEDGLSIFENDLGFKCNGVVNLPEFTYLTEGDPHRLTQGIDTEKIGISSYKQMELGEYSGFIPLMYCGDDPVVFARNWRNSKIVVMSFSINQSNLAISPYEFLFFMCNMIEYYMPTTLDRYCFEIGEKVSFNCKGASLAITDMRGETVGEFDEFPNEIVLDKLGTYTFTTRFSIAKENEVRKAYVRTPVSESSIFKMEDLGYRIMNSEYSKEMGKDLFFWFAVAVVVLLFFEYLLQYNSIVGTRFDYKKL